MRRYWKLLKLQFWTEYKGKCKYCNVLLKSPEINRLGKHEYLFMQDGAWAHTVKLTLGNDKRQETISITGAPSLTTE